MNNVVAKTFQKRDFITDFKNVSLDEKSYKSRYQYATILIDSGKDCILNMLDDEKKKPTRYFF